MNFVTLCFLIVGCSQYMFSIHATVPDEPTLSWTQISRASGTNFMSIFYSILDVS